MQIEFDYIIMEDVYLLNELDMRLPSFIMMGPSNASYKEWR